MSARRGRLTVLLVRDGEVTSRRFALSPARVIPLALLLLVFIAGAFGAGFWAAGLREPARVAELEARVDSLRGETAKVGQIAETLARVEASYERLRAVMGGEVAPSARDVLLPALEPESDLRDARRPEEARGPFLWPLVEAGFVTRTFGDSTAVREGGHAGLDVAVPSGSYVRASGSGRVAEAGEDDQYGRFVRLDHGDGVKSLYAHTSWVFVKAGDSVEAGEVIALSGNTGRSTAPHLHLEIEQNGEPVDPLPWVTGRL